MDLHNVTGNTWSQRSANWCGYSFRNIISTLEMWLSDRVMSDNLSDQKLIIHWQYWHKINLWDSFSQIYFVVNLYLPSLEQAISYLIFCSFKRLEKHVSLEHPLQSHLQQIEWWLILLWTRRTDALPYPSSPAPTDLTGRSGLPD
jgi:hypothetical protein